MTNSELELWNKIKAYEFDKPNLRLTFAKRLARENGISLAFANTVIDEYRRFIFLCCVSPKPVSPSRYVDLAWHLHLTYTRSYWIELCENTINRNLHHDPTQGGREEDEKYRGMYKCTLDLYEQYFLSKAPQAVWPTDNQRPNDAIVATEKSRFRVFPKPAFGLDPNINSFSLPAIILASLLFVCGAYAESVPFILIIILIIGAVILFAWRRNRQSRDGGSGCGSSGCGSGGRSDNADGSGCSSGCSGGCGGGD